ncbi:unnamed protein product [Rotaria sp. Silwood2]|nr:unnamed protein product [Rotaria sp. Silwood2]CAF4068218.1 unnamed protein product [Rotaria sp. Silwood2]CAF4181516.1 unnamed protein product [Rotaria sp. Silwood2]CAF4205799.1 unnamed protein product [Rotaria sp. Silwood2]
MPEPAPRRSLAARRCTIKVSEFDDDIDDQENSLNDSLTGRRQSRVLNNSFNGGDEPIQTPKQLVDLYQKTVELATQGKITIKNAFSIPLVERLPQILNVIALDDKDNHNLGPNFVKAGSVIDTSAKIYGFRVDALHTETQKLSGNILNTDEVASPDGEIKEEGRTDVNGENIISEEDEIKKPVRRVKAKTTTFVLTDLSKITLEHEFEFRPLQPPHMCRWRGGIGTDSIYAEMVSSTMYSSSDFPLIDGFTNANIQIEEEETKINSILDSTINHMIDLTSLRSVIKTNEGHDHVLGNQTLREFVFNEIPSGSFIDTVHESCLAQMDESMNKSCVTNDDIDNNDDGYNHEELIHAAIEDLNDDPSHANEVFKNALNELSNPDPSSIHSNLGNFQSQQSINSNLPSTNGLLSSSFMSTISFADQMPNLLNSKEGQSEYSYFDAAKLKLFAGPNIWKFTNLLNTTQPTINTSIVQQQQAPVTPHKITSIGREGGGPKRNIRIDTFNQISIEQIMLGYNNNGRDKKAVSTSQSSLLLRIRERSFNQMQLARKIRPLSDLTNFYNFPDLNIEYLDLINRRRELQQQHYYDQDDFDHQDFQDDNHPEDENGPLSEINYDFVRPIHYEKIEFAKGSSSVNAKILKRQMIEEFTRQKVEQQRTLSLDISTSSQQSSISSSQSQQQPTVEFSILCENLADHGYLSLQSDLASAFYCMLINCNENKLYMKNNSKRDDLFIQERPFIDQRDISTLSYSYTSHSNLSITN